MFKSKSFYHSHIRKAIIAFGVIFNNLKVTRLDAENAAVQSLEVPLTYGPKNKMITRIMEAPSLENGRATFSTIVPRIGFEITSLSYDASRKMNTIQTVRTIEDDNGVRYSFVSTPYNLGLSVTIFSKNQDDALQLLEQVLPHFNPDFNVSVNEIPSLGVQRDLQITLDSVEHADSYEGAIEDQRLITWDLKFTMKMNFFGYVNDAKQIKSVIQNIYLTSDVDAEGESGFSITTTADPLNQDPSDDYTFIREFDSIPPTS